MDVDRTVVRGPWWRQVLGGGDIHYVANPPSDFRWQRGHVIDAQYFADEPDTAWAEWYRYLAEAGVPPNRALPRDLWRWDVDVDEIADLRDETQLARVGLPQPLPGRIQWPLFQRVGEDLFADDCRGLIAPSAARPGNLVLCLFREAAEIVGATAVPPPENFREPPTVPRGMTT